MGEVLGRIIDRAHRLHPDELGDLAREAIEAIGGGEVLLYFVDLGQDVLLRYHGKGEDEIEIDTTLPGRAFRTNTPVTSDAVGGRRLWTPVIDGADRLGLLSAVFDDEDAVSTAIGAAMSSIAGLFAEMAVARSQYGDGIAQGRRRRPLSLASELRRGMLPPSTFDCGRVTISAVVEPAYEIAGDSFDYSVQGDTVHLAVFDAMGHGLEASRVANLVVGTYRHSRRVGLTIPATQRAIDAVVNDQFGDFTYATGVLVELDMATGILRVLLAGHPRPLLFRGHRFIGELEVAPTLPLGIGDPEPVVAEFQLEPDDRVLLYSDGVIEARDASGEPFGTERLADFLVRSEAAEEPLAETVRRLSKAILAHQDAPLQDDATLLLLHWEREDHDGPVG